MIGQFQHDLFDLSKLGVSDRGLSKHLEEIKKERLAKFIESIKKNLPHINFDRFRFDEMRWDGNAVCLPYERKDNRNIVQTLRYSLPEKQTNDASRFTNDEFMPSLAKLQQIKIPIGVDGLKVVLEDPFNDEWPKEPAAAEPPATAAPAAESTESSSKDAKIGNGGEGVYAGMSGALIPPDMNSLVSALRSGTENVTFSIDGIRRFLNIIMSPHYVGFKNNPYFIPLEYYETAKLLHGFLFSCGPGLYEKFIRHVNELGFREEELLLARPSTHEVAKGLRNGFSTLGQSLTPDGIIATIAFDKGSSRKFNRSSFEWLAKPWLLVAGVNENQMKAIFDSWEHRDGAITHEPWFDDVINRSKEAIYRALPKGKSLSPVMNFLFKWTRLDYNVPTEARMLYGYEAIRSIKGLRNQNTTKALPDQKQGVKKLTYASAEKGSREDNRENSSSKKVHQVI